MAWTSIRRAMERRVGGLMLRAAERENAFPRPDDAPVVHVAGGDPYRVLVAGGVIAAGLGVGSHKLGLAGHLARQLAAMSGHGVDVDILGIPFVSADRLADELRRTELARYDAVVLLAGGVEVLVRRSTQRWNGDVTALLAAVHDAVPRLPIVVCAIPQLGSVVRLDPSTRARFARRTDRLNAETVRVVAATPGARYLDVPPFGPNNPHGRTEMYAADARAIAPVLVQELALSTAGRHRALDIDEEARLAALDALAILDTGPDPRFDAIVRAAAELLDMKSAAITFVARDRLWMKAAVGLDAIDVPMTRGLCNETIVRTGAYLVDDVRTRPDLDDRRALMDAQGLRAYAGYPLEALAGEHVGTISVADPEPHAFTEQDVAVLRSLALQAQTLVQEAAASSLNR